MPLRPFRELERRELDNSVLLWSEGDVDSLVNGRPVALPSWWSECAPRGQTRYGQNENPSGSRLYVSLNFCSQVMALQSGLKSLALLLVAWFAQKREHVLLVSFHTWLVERIDTENIGADSAGIFKEIEQAAEVECVDFLD